MKDIVEFLTEWAKDNNLSLIVDTSYGLNVDRDRNVSDRKTHGDRDAIFFNISETGTMSLDEYGRKLTIDHTYELGLFKKCYKESEGLSYYSDLSELMALTKKIFKALSNEYKVINGSYSNAIDQLDSNNVAIKLNFVIEEEDDDFCS